MGLGCLRNALRCRRLHCYFTGPLFLLLAVLSLLHGTGGVDLGSNGWGWIGGFALVGGVGLTVLPERLWGRYRSPAEAARRAGPTPLRPS